MSQSSQNCRGWEGSSAGSVNRFVGPGGWALTVNLAICFHSSQQTFLEGLPHGTSGILSPLPWAEKLSSLPSIEAQCVTEDHF